MARLWSKAIAPTQILLVILFFILGIGEFLDGIFDVGDFAVPFLLALSLNNIYLTHYKVRSALLVGMDGGEEQKKIGDPENPVIKKLFIKIRLRTLVNLAFFTLIFSPIIFSAFGFQHYVLEGIFQIGFVLWSGTFLAISVKNFKKNLAFGHFIYCNIAFALLMTSIILI